jgi:REP element-mobilizing transposase RayT
MDEESDPSEQARRLERLSRARTSRPGELRSGSERQKACGVHSRGYLPHVKVDSAAYFVTFRLADSIPASAIEQMRADIDNDIVRQHERRRLRSTRDCDEKADDAVAFDETRTRHRAQFAVLDRWLDAGHGHCWLRRPEVADMVAAALRHFENDRYLLHAWCVMPNHVHAVVQPLMNWALSQILHSWKSFTSKAAARLIGSDAPRTFWMPESYDHWCRDAGEVDRCRRYTLHNPVKARFCQEPSSYRWCGPHPHAAP